MSKQSGRALTKEQAIQKDRKKYQRDFTFGERGKYRRTGRGKRS